MKLDKGKIKDCPTGCGCNSCSGGSKIPYYKKYMFVENGKTFQYVQGEESKGIVYEYNRGDMAGNANKYQAMYANISTGSALDNDAEKTSPPLIPDGWYDKGVGGSTLLSIPKQGEEDFILRLTYYKDGLPVGSPKNVVVHTKTT